MKMHTTFRLGIVATLFLAIVGAGYYFLLRPPTPVTVTPDALFGWKFPQIKLPETGGTYSEIRPPGGLPQGLPVRLQIPSIRVDTAIEDALITPDGRMDVPAGTVDVAWFSLGPHPGQVGSAVIGGHYGIRNGVPFVFYNLNKLKVGDKVYIIDDNDTTIAFVIRSIESLDRNADATTVFTSTDGLAHLNLITCEGVWNQVNGNYPQRLVVFADEIASEGTAPSTFLTLAAFPRTLSLGISGPDVSALQTALEQKGFLIMPPKIGTGYFGTLTRTAVMAYQTSVGLSPVGIFGPMTRGRLITSLATHSILPYTGTEYIATSTESDAYAAFIYFLQSLGSLYATPFDAIITFLILISIAFMSYKIVRIARRNGSSEGV